MDTAASDLINRLAALEAENAALRSQLQSCEQSCAVLQAEVIELRQRGQVSSNAEVLVNRSAKAVNVISSGEALKRSLDLLSTDPDLDNMVGHVLTAIAHQFQSPLTEYWSQDEHTAYVERIYWKGQILDRAAIRHVFPCHVGLEGFKVPPAMIDGLPLRQRKKTIVYDDHSVNPFTKDLPWVISVLLVQGLPKEINVPLFLQDTTIGALTIHLPQDYQFTTEQIELAQALGHQVTLVAEMQRLAEAAKQAAISHERELAAQERAAELAKANESLQRSLNQLANDRNLESFLGRVLQEAIR
ncbi:MAG: GAF domain-containing protein, partial [Leptolyngbyaceae cyanobacterium bins.59]|nr:GAF domain-containing protein [Leptolyngbyaceae cyanobacterium bins.59]